MQATRRLQPMILNLPLPTTRMTRTSTTTVPSSTSSWGSLRMQPRTTKNRSIWIAASSIRTFNWASRSTRWDRWRRLWRRLEDRSRALRMCRTFTTTLVNCYSINKTFPKRSRSSTRPWKWRNRPSPWGSMSCLSSTRPLHCCSGSMTSRKPRIYARRL